MSTPRRELCCEKQSARVKPWAGSTWSVTAAGPKDAPHLAKRCVLVPKEHQAELTQRRVELAGIERQRFRSCLAPVDLRGLAASHGQHARVQVHAHGRPARSDGLGRVEGQDAGPARHVQDPHARAELRRLHQLRGPCRKERRNEELVVDLGGTRRDLS